MNKHYLICGGAGFIGVNLARELLDLGHRVSVIDNLWCGNKNNLPKEVFFYENCIRDDLSHVFDSNDFNGIFNLACPASPKNYQEDPIFTIDSCVGGMQNLLEYATEYDIPILQASTSEVYGSALVSPQTEEYLGNVNCTGIRACYDEGKRLAETICFEYFRRYKTKIRVVRIFNTYGPYMSKNDGRVISNFITQALEGNELTVYGDGNQTRSFCYVSDMVKGLISAINSDFTGPTNLGNPSERTILDTANTINNLIGNDKSNIKQEPIPSDDPPQRCPDISKAKSKFNWEPTVKFEDGISKTIEYYKTL